MFYLSFMTIVWAFSFSLIGEYLAGQVDSWFAVLIRISLATLVFIPFLNKEKISFSLKLKFMLIGAFQLGFMYLFYYKSFLYLSVPEVLLFTVLTPVYVTLIYDLYSKKFSAGYLVTALIAVCGAIIIKYDHLSADFLLGFLIVQGANFCFAVGQVSYKKVMETENKTCSHKVAFSWFYMGAFIVACVAFILFGNVEKMPNFTYQWLILLYLGVIASGLGYYLWNRGACLVNAGALAIMNNALVPAGLIVNILIWNRDANFLRLAIGGFVIVLSLFVNEKLVKWK